MNEIININDIPSDVFFLGDNIFFKEGNSIIKIGDSFKKKEILTFDFSFVIESIADNIIFIRTKYKIIKLYVRKKYIAENHDFKVLGAKQLKYISNNWFLIRQEINDEWVLAKNSFNSNDIWSIKAEEDFSILYATNSLFAVQEELLLKCFNCLDARLLWKQSYLNLLEGKEIHQYGNTVVHDDILYMYLADNKDGRNFATVAIDILTGEKINTYTGFGGDLFLYGDKIGVASAQNAQILNTQTRQINDYDLSEFLEKKELNISWNSFILTEGDILYFIADDHRQGSHIGIINLVENELVWLYDVNGNKDLYDISVRSIKLSAGRLYAHCSDQTLRIFE